MGQAVDRRSSQLNRANVGIKQINMSQSIRIRRYVSWISRSGASPIITRTVTDRSTGGSPPITTRLKFIFYV